MFVRIRRRLGADEGMTLVELMVALFVLAIVLTAVASTLMTSLVAVRRAEGATKARQIAQQELETLQALDWQDAGFYQAEATAASHLGGSTFNGEELVILPPQSPRPSQIPHPEDTVEVDGFDFAVRRVVTWRNTGDGDHKHFTVFVDYGPAGDVRTVEMTALRAPAPSNAVRVFAIDTFTVAPDEVERAASGTFTPSTVDVTVTTSSAADSFVQLFSEHEDGTVSGPVNMLTSDGGFTWTAALNPTVLGWAEGVVTLRVEAQRGVLSADDSRTLTVLTEGAPPVIEVRNVTVTQTGVSSVICSSNGGTNAGKPTPNAVVRADIRGLGSADVNRVQVNWNGSGSATPIQMSFDQNTTDGLGAWFKLTVDNNYRFIQDPTNFTVYVDGVPTPSTGAFSFPRFAKGGGASDVDDCD